MPLYITSLYGICGILMLLLSVIVLVKDFSSKVNKMFSFFGMSVVLWILFLYLGFYFATTGNNDVSFIFGRLTYGASIWFPLFLTLFFYYFPRKTFDFSGMSKFLLFFTSTALFFTVVFTPLIHESQVIEDHFWVADTFGSLYWMYLLYTVGHLFLVVGIAINKIIETRGIEQKKTIIASIGLFIFSIITLLTNVILPNFNLFILQTESVSFSLLFLIPTFYSIQKYRFFDFSYAALGILRQLILFSVFFLTVFIIYNSVGSLIYDQYDGVAMGLSGLGGLIIYSILNRFFPEFISREFKEFRYKIDQLKSSIYYCNNYHDLFKKLESTFVLDLHFTSVQLFLIRSKKNHIEIPIYYKDRFTESIEKGQVKILVTEELKLQKNKFYLEFLDKMEASICFPLYLEKRLIGFFSLSQKSKHESFSREEIEELMKSKQFVELCFINILLQSDLKEENDLMKQLIHEKTKSLKKQNEKIKYLLNQQSDFIAVTAHEFRTPLNIALLQLEDTLDSYEHSTHVLEDMKVLESSLEKLKHLTQNLFDVQQYDLNKVKIYAKEIDLNWFITDIYEEFRDIMAKKKIQLDLKNHLKKPTLVEIDEPKMRQVLHNLLTNSQKFTQESGKITIQAETIKNMIMISVIDNGPGISAKDKQRIFEKFQTTKSHMGMGIGLGLYLCKSIIDLHKGNIEITDTPGGGATFTLKIPKEVQSIKKPKKTTR